MSILAFIGAALVGWLIADLLGGFVHWWEDRVARPRLPWLVKHVFEPNQFHHVDPMAFTRSGFWTRNGTTMFAASVAGALWLAIAGPSVILLFAFLGGALQNEVHYLAHNRPAGWLAVFQQIGFIQSVPGHAKHHMPPQNKNYCVLTDWCNPILEHLDVWNRIERRLKLTVYDTET